MENGFTIMRKKSITSIPMRREILLWARIMAIAFCFQINSRAAELPGFHVQGRYLLDHCGQKVMLRGVNEMTTWTSRSGGSLSEIAQTGANVVRIVTVVTDKSIDLDKWIGLSIKSGMIPMPESHSATGEWAKLGSLFDFWTQPEVVPILIKYEKELLLNIGNEVGDGSVTTEQWVAAYTSGIKKMRALGIHACIVVDAPSYGQNIDVVIAGGLDLQAADPDHNLLFSVHCYWIPAWGWSDQKMKDKIQAVIAKDIPFIFGEFGNSWDLTPTGAIPYKLLLEECQRLEIGWMAWSWGPGNKPQTWLDMTKDGTFHGLQDWGLEVATTLPGSIKNTSVKSISITSQTCQVNSVRPKNWDKRRQKSKPSRFNYGSPNFYSTGQTPSELVNLKGRILLP